MSSIKIRYLQLRKDKYKNLEIDNKRKRYD